jgi:DNA-binding PadR family transcriptional regulator
MDDGLVGFGREYTTEELALLDAERGTLDAVRSDKLWHGLEDKLAALEREGQRNTVTLTPIQARCLILIERINAGGTKAYGLKIAELLGEKLRERPYNAGQIYGIMQTLVLRGFVGEPKKEPNAHGKGRSIVCYALTDLGRRMLALLDELGDRAGGYTEKRDWHGDHE